MPRPSEIADKKRLLCVSDNLDTRVLLLAFLNDYHVTVVSAGDEAVGAARRCPFHLYVLDTWLADMSGVELCRKIRLFDSNTPILFFSAAADDRDRKEAIAAGAQAYVVKHVDFLRLGQMINQLISKADLLSLEAKLAEIAAMRDVIQGRLARAEVFIQKADKIAFKRKALQVYLDAGGTLADFGWLWNQIIESEFPRRLNSQSAG